MASGRENTNLSCSFCGEFESDGAQIIAGAEAWICWKCVGKIRPEMFEQRDTETNCSFSPTCKTQNLYGDSALICHDCLDLCLEIVDDWNSPAR